MLKSKFLFTTCHVGAEPSLKREVTRNHPELKSAFSRPGFVTFKNDQVEMDPDFTLQSVFARTYALSFGKFSTFSEVRKFVEMVPPEIASQEKIHLHVVERDIHPPGEEPLGFEQGRWENNALRELAAIFQDSSMDLAINLPPKTRSLVVTIVLVESNEGWIGFHRHSPQHSPLPGGKSRISLPSNAPSRAYLKMEEALLWSRAPIRAGDVAVELGSAPGGSCYSLLEKGLQVIGMDAAEMAPLVLKHPGYRHIPRSTASFQRSDFPVIVQWLASDMNVSLDFSLRIIENILPTFRSTLLGVLLTFKLNNWRYAESIPALLDRLRELGLSRVRATQLASHRQEIFVFGLTRSGLLRSPPSSISVGNPKLVLE